MNFATSSTTAREASPSNYAVTASVLASRRLQGKRRAARPARYRGRWADKARSSQTTTVTYRSARFPLFLVVAFCVGLSACVPVHPSKEELVGPWGVVWKCGTETLELKADATYVQDIEFAVGGHATHQGTWTLIPKAAHLEGGHVVLHDAMDFCSAFGEKLGFAERRDRKLETIWEWGRVILSFNPDVEGFRRRR